jgi:hypothetical protein
LDKGQLGQSSEENDTLTVRKQRPRPPPKSTLILSRARSNTFLSPTAEETPKSKSLDIGRQLRTNEMTITSNALEKENNRPSPAIDISFLSNTETPNNTLALERKHRKETRLSAEYGKSATPRKTHSKDNRTTKTPLTNTKEKMAEISKSKSQCQRYYENQDMHAPRHHQEPTHKSSSQQEKGKGTKSVRSLLHNHFRGALEVTSRPSHQLNPEITISRPSFKAGELAGSGNVRRVPASEPGGLRAGILVASPCRVSRSFIDDPKRRNAWAENSKPLTIKDPLSRVSNEEDLASLAVLAQVLDDESANPDATNIDDPVGAALSVNEKSSVDIEWENLFVPVLAANNTPGDLTQLFYAASVFDPQTNDTSGPATAKQRSVRSTGTNIARPPSPMTPPSRSPIRCSLNKGCASPSSNVKALVAKLNATKADASFISPTKMSLTKSLIGETRARFEPAKGSIVAPYTTNPPPSPTRSQKSGKSEKTPKSTTTPLTTNQNRSRQTSPSLTKISTRGQPLKESLSSSTFVRLPINDTSMSPSETAPQIPENPDTVPLRSTENHVNYITSTENPLLSSEPSSRCSMSTLEEISARIESSDGPRGSFSHGTILPHPDLPPVAQYVHFVRPPPGLPNSESLGPSNTLTVVRSNSMLHTQVRNIQQANAALTEENRQLRQRVAIHSGSEIGILSMKLRETTREKDAWKARALAAEKQNEMRNTAPSRPASHPASTGSTPDKQFSTKLDL